MKVDFIIAGIKELCDKLEQAAEANTKKQLKVRSKIVKLEDTARSLGAEADRARAFRKNIGELINLS